MVLALSDKTFVIVPLVIFSSIELRNSWAQKVGKRDVTVSQGIHIAPGAQCTTSFGILHLIMVEQV